MKKKAKKEMICDWCGSYWSASLGDPQTCGICGTGGKIKIGSKLDWRRDLRGKEIVMAG